MFSGVLNVKHCLFYLCPPGRRVPDPPLESSSSEEGGRRFKGRADITPLLLYKSCTSAFKDPFRGTLEPREPLQESWHHPEPRRCGCRARSSPLAVRVKLWLSGVCPVCRTFWSAWRLERSSSGTEASWSLWRREVTWRRDRWPPRPPPSTQRRVRALLRAALTRSGAGWSARLILLIPCRCSAPAAPGVPARGLHGHADVHLLRQRRQAGEQRQHAELHRERARRTSRTPRTAPLPRLQPCLRFRVSRSTRPPVTWPGRWPTRGMLWWQGGSPRPRPTWAVRARRPWRPSSRSRSMSSSTRTWTFWSQR